MSKFNELCKFYSTARTNYFTYWHECSEFVTELLDGLMKYFDMPDDKLKFVPLRDKPEFGKSYSAKDSMHLEKDTFWYLGLLLTLCGQIKNQPEETLVLPLLIKKIDDNYVVKLGPEGEAFEIHQDNAASCPAFYDNMYDQVKNTYKDRLHKFLDGAQSERRIGFATPE
ncbi:MAG: hypothetical protein GY839_05985 [candidate division Zixibacteria bacterium]|nr:hypothetical protein [candidate division Zixibacteria bacterium]